MEHAEDWRSVIIQLIPNSYVRVGTYFTERNSETVNQVLFEEHLSRFGRLTILLSWILLAVNHAPLVSDSYMLKILYITLVELVTLNHYQTCLSTK